MSWVVFCLWSFSSDLEWLFLIKLSRFILRSVKRIPPVSPGFGRKSEMGGVGEKKGVDDLDISVLFKFFIGLYSCISYVIKHTYTKVYHLLWISLLLSETKVLVQKKEFLNIHEVPICLEGKTKQEQLPGSRACCQLSETAGGPAGDQICPPQCRCRCR